MRLYKILAISLLLLLLAPAVPGIGYGLASKAASQRIRLEAPLLVEAGVRLLTMSPADWVVATLAVGTVCAVMLVPFRRRKHEPGGQVDPVAVLQTGPMTALDPGETDEPDDNAREQPDVTESAADPKTSLLSRASILKLLDSEMSRAIRDRTILSLVMVDVDHFGILGERHGNAAADEVIRELSKRIGFAIRNYDSAGHYGEDEFLLVMPNFEGDAGVERLRKVHEMICGAPVLVSSGPISVTCSFGVSVFVAGHYCSAEVLIENARMALQTAKDDGRNRIGFYARPLS